MEMTRKAQHVAINRRSQYSGKAHRINMHVFLVTQTRVLSDWTPENTFRGGKQSEPGLFNVPAVGSSSRAEISFGWIFNIWT